MTPTIAAAISTLLGAVGKPIVKAIGDRMARSKRPVVVAVVTWFRGGAK